jgi:hypothetical protein
MQPGMGTLGGKKYWLLPIVLMFVLFGMLVVSQTSAIAPFIYTLFRG